MTAMSRQEDKGKKVASEPSKKNKYTITQDVEPIWARMSQSLVIREPRSDGRPPHRSSSPTYLLEQRVFHKITS